MSPSDQSEPIDRSDHQRWLQRQNDDAVFQYVSDRLTGNNERPARHPLEEEPEEYLQDLLERAPDDLRARVTHAVARFLDICLRSARDGVSMEPAKLFGVQRVARLLRSTALLSLRKMIEDFIFDENDRLRPSTARFASSTPEALATTQSLMQSMAALQERNPAIAPRWQYVLKMRKPMDFGVEGFWGLARSLGKVPDDSDALVSLAESARERETSLSFPLLWSVLSRAFPAMNDPKRAAVALGSHKDVKWARTTFRSVVNRMASESSDPSISARWRSLAKLPDPLRVEQAALNATNCRRSFTPMSRHPSRLGRTFEDQVQP